VTSNTEYFNINHFALQELNISQSFSLAPGNRTIVNVEPCCPGLNNLHWGKQQHNLPLIIFWSVFYLIFVCKLFSARQLQWLLPPMEVGKFQHPTKSSLWRSDDGLIAEKIKAEVYLGSMESKHTTRFTRKKRAKK
jgi:4-amino-4-deoxy-L-arabinose transferase-like glycosyltransferase